MTADGDPPQTPIDGVGGAERRNRQAMVFQVLELLGTLEGAVAYRREDGELRCEGAQCDLEAHLVVTGRRAAVRHHGGLERHGHLRDGLRLQHALGAHAQWVGSAAAHVPHDQILQHLIEVGGAGVDEMVLERAELCGARGQRRARLGVEPAGVDRDGDHRPPIGLLQPGHTERGIETAGKCQQNGRSARIELGCHEGSESERGRQGAR